MTKFTKISFAIISLSLIAGCSLEDKPTEKDIKVALKMTSLLRGYGDRTDYEKTVCNQIPYKSESAASRHYANGLMKEEVIPKESQNPGLVRSYESFVNVGLMTKSDTSMYVQGQLVPAYSYKLTELGAQHFVKKLGSNSCFQAGKIVPGSLIPGLDENGEKEKDLIVKKQVTKEDAKIKAYYQAWVEQKVVDQAPWVSNVGANDLMPEVRELSNLEAKKVAVAKYKDMWLPYSMVVELLEIDNKLVGKSPEEVLKLQTRYLEPIIKQYKTASAIDTSENSISSDKLAAILDLAKKSPQPFLDSYYERSSASAREYLTMPVKLQSSVINSTTFVPSNTLTIDKMPQFNEDQTLQAELDKYLKANPQSATSDLAKEMKNKITAMKNKKDSQLNSTKEFTENLELLVQYGFASKQDSTSTVIYTFKDGVVLSKKQDVVIAQIPAFKYEYGNVLKSQVKQEADLVQGRAKVVEVEVELKGKPEPAAQELIKANPGLYKPYTQATITVSLSDNPGRPYSISNVAYKQ